MKVGITYNLRQEYLDLGMDEEETAEFDRPDTIEHIESALQGLGYQPDRIGGVENLVRRLAAGERWDLVFNIAEGLHGFGREAQVPALLEAFSIPYTFSDVLVLSLTLHKAMTKRVIRDLGIPTPEFAMVDNREDVSGVRLPFPLFAKPVAEGTGKGVTSASKINNQEELLTVCSRLLSTYKQPVLVETFLPGREFTVGILGTGREARVLGVVEVILLPEADQEVYSYRNKEICELVVEYRLVADDEAKEASAVALAAWQGLGCRDGGRIDLRSDGNSRPHFMEVNPLAGLHPEHSDLCIIASKNGISYLTLIDSIMSSALKRYGMEKKTWAAG